jgi:ATP adenylyltransferase
MTAMCSAISFLALPSRGPAKEVRANKTKLKQNQTRMRGIGATRGPRLTSDPSQRDNKGMARRDSGKKAAKGGKLPRVKRVKRAPQAGSATGEDWPLKRQVLFKPERLKYVRKQIETTGCVFCEAVSHGRSRESLVLYADDVKMVIMNKFPYNTGHLLVLPRRHEGDLTSLSKTEVDEIFEMVQTVTGFLKETYKPAGFNIGINLGSGAGAGIPEHLHVHVIPRWNGDTNFFPLIAQTKVVVETLEQTYDRLIPYFDSLR